MVALEALVHTASLCARLQFGEMMMCCWVLFGAFDLAILTQTTQRGLLNRNLLTMFCIPDLINELGSC